MAIGPDGMWYMTPEEQRISDAIEGYKHNVSLQIFGYNRVVRGLPESFRFEGHVEDGMLFYRSTYLVLHAQYQGGP